MRTRWTGCPFLILLWLVLASICLPCVARADDTKAMDNPLVIAATNPDGGSRVALNEGLLVQVSNLEILLDKAGGDFTKIILHLDGRPLRDLHAVAKLTSPNRVGFDLRRNPQSKETWAALLGKPGSSFERSMSVSIGLENAAPIDTEVKDGKAIHFVLVREAWFWGFVIAFVVVFGLFLWLARTSDVIRDPGPSLGAGQRRPYSLARTQMAFWLFLVISSYVLIWLITDDRDSITTSVNVLMAISAATAVGAALIDAGSTRTTPPNPQQAAAAAGQVTGASIPSRGFLTDILSEDDGVSLHRFQIFVWTLVLGVIFVNSVYTSLAMPEFSGTLLALMGISSGTYVGFKGVVK